MKGKSPIPLILALIALWVVLGGVWPFPGPGPTPVPPIPADKLTVLILEETADRAKLPPSQLTALSSSQATAYLKAKGADWHHWDASYAGGYVAMMTDVFKQAYAKAKADSNGVMPWILISNGKSGTSQAFPKTEAELMDLLRRYGGE